MQMLEQRITNCTKLQPASTSPGKLKTYPRGIYTKHNTTPSKPSDIAAKSIGHDREYLIKRKNYKICLINSHEQRIEANKLIKDRYASKGYITDNSTVPHKNLHQITFEASNNHQLFGTITLTIDSSEGLSAENLYTDEINNFRNKNKKVCELSRFASYTEHGSKEIFAALFHLAYIYAHILHDVNDAVIEVNPRHVFFYKRMLGFRQIGVERICERVNAPAVLLHLDLNYMKKQISSLSCQNNFNSRTIYPYFLSQHEEKRLVKNLEKVLRQEKNKNSTRRINTQPNLVTSCHQDRSKIQVSKQHKPKEEIILQQIPYNTLFA